MNYKKYEEGDAQFLAFGEEHFDCCCDCGLVHRYIIEREHGGQGIIIRMWRDDRRTAQVRRGKNVSLLKGGSGKWTMRRR